MVALPIAKPLHALQLAPGSLVTISGVSWNDYETLLVETGDRSGTRIFYSDGTLELMSPLPEHEIPCDVLADGVKLLFKRAKIPNQPFGSTTFKRLGIAGVEPDACFYIQNMSCMIGKRRLSPGDPPPDLALETDVTSKTALAAYEAIGVPELWIYDSGVLNLYELRDGKYSAIDRSPIFPDLDLRVLLPQLIDRAWAIGSYAALEEFEKALECFE